MLGILSPQAPEGLCIFGKFPLSRGLFLSRNEEPNEERHREGMSGFCVHAFPGLGFRGLGFQGFRGSGVQGFRGLGV